MHLLEEETQRVLLAAVDTGEYDVEESMEELAELVRSAGGEVKAQVIQPLPSIRQATYLGIGKLKEVKEAAERLDVNLLIFDTELTGAQMRNIEAETGIPVIDRTMLILDIFAQRARTNEGKLQVELAQQKYRLPRLIGMGQALSRQGGGIGTRGPGETKLESDRRHIRRRIESLTRQLDELKRRRGDLRKRRQKSELPVVSLVGYTNVGKSSLLNALTDANVYAENQLFATLDTTSRRLSLPSGKEAILTDTVGLLSRLPHELIEAFSATLEEAASSDLILHVCNLSNPRVAEQKEIAEQLLCKLGCTDIPMITVYNQCDRVPLSLRPRTNDHTAVTSALTKEGLDDLLLKIEQLLSAEMQSGTFLLPYQEGALLSEIRKLGRVDSTDFEEGGIRITASMPKRLFAQASQYACTDTNEYSDLE